MKTSIELNTEILKIQRMAFTFFKPINSSAFGKTIENMQKHRIINFVTNNKKKHDLVSEPNYHSTKWFYGILFPTEMKKTHISLRKPVSILVLKFLIFNRDG